MRVEVGLSRGRPGSCVCSWVWEKTLGRSFFVTLEWRQHKGGRADAAEGWTNQWKQGGGHRQGQAVRRREQRRMGMHEAPVARLRVLMASGERERRPVKREAQGDHEQRCENYKRARNCCAEL